MTGSIDLQITDMRSRHLAIRAWLAGLVVTALSACGSNGSPAQPSAAPAPAPVPAATALTIVGQTILSAGMTSQLTAHALDGSTVAGATWTSATPTVATVSPQGLITAIGDGTSAITASASSLNARGFVTVLVQPSGSSTVVLSACTNITSPGRYVVDRDLPTPSPCFRLSNVADVQLDCLNHSMLAIVLDHASRVTVANCVVAANIKMTNVDAVTVSGSTITNGILWEVQSTNVVFSGNTLRITNTGLGSPIFLDSGSNNRVVNNTVIGGYDGGRANVGADDGIIIANESGDVVEGNSISNVYDAGIEGLGALTGTRLANNTMNNLGITGIGSYWCTAWTNTSVEGNSVTSAPRLAYIFYDTGSKCSGPIVPAAFSDNQFIGNMFHNPAPGTSTGTKFPAIRITMPGSVQRNLIQGNDLGTSNGPLLTPLDGFIDGGGNLCGPFDAVFSNFPCAQSARSSTFTVSPRLPSRPRPSVSGASSRPAASDTRVPISTSRRSSR